MDDFDPDELVVAHNLRIFSDYQRHQRFFTAKQWLVVCLKFERGLSNVEIAKRLGRAESTVSDLLGRAHLILDACERKLRRESYEVRRTRPEE